jgi:hypothetical protein
MSLSQNRFTFLRDMLYHQTCKTSRRIRVEGKGGPESCARACLFGISIGVAHPCAALKRSVLRQQGSARYPDRNACCCMSCSKRTDHLHGSTKPHSRTLCGDTFADSLSSFKKQCCGVPCLSSIVPVPGAVWMSASLILFCQRLAKHSGGSGLQVWHGREMRG